jgi:hypothetical protein
VDRILDLLKKNRGLKVSYEYEYEHTDTPAGRVAVKRDKKEIRSIFIPLRDDEWCSLCMRDRSDYIGDCCDQTGQTQDILNKVFRDSGWINGDTAHELVSVAGSHDGFDILREKSEEKLIEAEPAWNGLDPHGKIFFCVAAALPFMKMNS